MRRTKHRTLMLAAGSLLLLAAMPTGLWTTSAYLVHTTATQVNSFAPAQLDIAVVENHGGLLEETRAGPYDSGSAKVVQLQNKGPDAGAANAIPAYMRAALVPVWRPTGQPEQNAAVGLTPWVLTGNTLTADYEGREGSITLQLDENWAAHWRRGADGWFYYKGALAPDGLTEPLLAAVTYTSLEGMTPELQVLADGVQAMGSNLPGWTSNCTA